MTLGGRHVSIGFLFLLVCFSGTCFSQEKIYPRGFFLENLRQNPPAPAFYDLDKKRIVPFPFKSKYSNFIDFHWDQKNGRVFFSAKEAPQDPFRVYVKAWPEGPETVVYETTVGPFRFVVSPDGNHLAVQIMGPRTWPILGVYDWQKKVWVDLGEGYSPFWSADSNRLLYLHLPGSLPTYLKEYRIDQSTSTHLMDQPVMEAVYTDDPEQLVIKAQDRAKACDAFEIWNRREESFHYLAADAKRCKEKGLSQRQLMALPGNQFFVFREQKKPEGPSSLVVIDAWGGRLQEMAPEDWYPRVGVVDETTLVMGQDPLYITNVDGTGGRQEIPQAGFIRFKR